MTGCESASETAPSPASAAFEKIDPVGYAGTKISENQLAERMQDAGALHDKDKQADAYARIAIDCAASDNMDGAEAAIKQLDGAYRDGVAAAAALTFARKEDFASAGYIAYLIRDDKRRDEVQTEIGHILMPDFKANLDAATEAEKRMLARYSVQAPPTKAGPDDTAEQFVTPAGHVHFETVGVSLKQPEGFEPAESFPGFLSSADDASVMVVSLPSPYRKSIEGFGKQWLASQGITLLSRTETRIGHLPGILLQAEEADESGVEHQKWILLFGDEDQTKIVTASYVKEAEAKYSDALKAVVSDARFSGRTRESSIAGSLGAGTKRLKRVRSVTFAEMYTKDGKPHSKDPKDPLFLVAPSLRQVYVPDRKAYAMQRYLATEHVKELKLHSIAPVIIDGVDGYQLIGEGLEAESGTPLAIHLTMLFPEQVYVVLQGLVGKTQQTPYMSEFLTLTQSWKRPPSAGDDK